jgi:hypothetical protein
MGPIGDGALSWPTRYTKGQPVVWESPKGRHWPGQAAGCQTGYLYLC